jgi:(E)-4-hydroxy-3-methylbut-2-enyl-diphosphate synthase
MTDADAVAGRIVEELGVTLAMLTTALGVRTGLWAALAGAGPLTPRELAKRTGTAPALAREWCRTQAAGSYLRLDGERGEERYVLPVGVAAALVHGPMGALVDAATSMLTATAVRFGPSGWRRSGPPWSASSRRRPAWAVDDGGWGTRPSGPRDRDRADPRRAAAHRAGAPAARGAPAGGREHRPCRISTVPPSRPPGTSEGGDTEEVSVSLGMPAAPVPTLAPRRPTRQLQVGPVGVGSEHPISVQSMTTTLTADVNATLQQIAELTAAGCDIVRVACPSQDDADALPAIARKSQIPVIADIHFQPKYVFAAIEAGCAGVRVNPGNIRKFDDQVKQIAAAASDHGTPIRIGVNAGSLDKRLLEKHGKATPEALVESALWEASLFAEHDFSDVKISVKHHDPVVMVRAYELLAASCDYPLHLGVTEAGPAFQGTIKSAVAFGALLSKGIGDTIRVSLSAPPVEEVKVGIQILQSLNLKQRKLEIVSCPSCGRAQVDVYKLANEVTAGLTGMEVPLRVAVMGCVVNGPGEAREADLGVASGNGKGQIFVKGEVIKTVPEHAIVETLIEEAMRLAEGMGEGGHPQVTVG